MNGHVCCVLGVCCPPGSPAQRDALRDEMQNAGVNDPESAADFVLKHFDLAPKGSLKGVQDWVREERGKDRV